MGGGVKERGQRRERAEERSLEGGNGNRSILKEEEVKERFKTKMTEKCFFFFFFFAWGVKAGSCKMSMWHRYFIADDFLVCLFFFCCLFAKSNDDGRKKETGNEQKV